MRLRLWHRLFIALAGLSIAALAAFAWLQQDNLQRGFLDYLNRLSLERIAEPARHLGEEYARQGNWQFAEGNERALMRALGLAPPEPGGQFPRPPFQDASGQSPDGDRGFRPPPPRRGSREFGPPPPRDDGGSRPPPRGSGNFGTPPQSEAGAPRNDQPGNPAPGPPPRPDGPPPRPSGPLDLAPRLLLLDSAGHVINGNPDVARDAPSIAIVSNDRQVATLLLQPLPRLRGGIDVAFARDQLLHAGFAALLVLIGALAVAWALARWLLAPIRELSDGTRTLAAGDYARRLSSTRSDEFGELAADFNRLASALDANQRARRQWGADIAHELRTPISILRGEIQALQDGVRPCGPETLASLQAECGRLAGLVQDLYDLALSDAGALSYRFETLDLAAELRDAVAAQQAPLRDAGLELQLTVPVASTMPIRADRQRLAQLFGNLLSNSCRYTDAPGRVRVGAVREGSAWRVTIDDTAPGVPADALERVFDRLYRVEPSRSRAFGGAGLGLSICRNIVEAHGGRIDADTSPDGGLRIRVLLPASEG